MTHFFKFSSAAKEFEQLASVSFSVTVDAFTVKPPRRAENANT